MPFEGQANLSMVIQSNMHPTVSHMFDDLPPELSDIAYDELIHQENMSYVYSSWSDDKAFLPTVITYGAAFVVGTIGNLCVVISLLLDKQARNVTSSFLVSLALADLVFLFVCVPYETMLKHAEYWSGGLALCKLSGFIEMLSGCATVFNLTAISVERYCVIVHPMKSRSWFTMGHTRKLIVAVWLAAAVLASPMLKIMNMKVYLFYNANEHHITTTCEDFNFDNDVERIVFAWYQFLLMFGIPTIIMVYCYTLVIRVLWASTKQLAKMTHTKGDSVEESRRLTNGGGNKNIKVKDQSQEVREARKQVIKMLLMVIAIFLLCWGPKLMLNMFKEHSLKFMHQQFMFDVLVAVNILPYVQSASNPIIYGFMSKNFRRSMMVSCRKCRRTNRRLNAYDMETKSMTINGGGYATTRYTVAEPHGAGCGAPKTAVTAVTVTEF